MLGMGEEAMSRLGKRERRAEISRLLFIAGRSLGKVSRTALLRARGLMPPKQWRGLHGVLLEIDSAMHGEVVRRQ